MTDLREGELIKYYTDYGWRTGHFTEYIKRTGGKGKNKYDLPPTYAQVEPIGGIGAVKHKVKIAVANIERAK